MLYLMENEYMTTHKVMAADSSSLDGLNNRSVKAHSHFAALSHDRDVGRSFFHA